MQKSSRRTKAERNAIAITLSVAFLFILAAIALGLWHTAEIRNIVSRQFNEEQLVVARHVAGLVERELGFLEKELKLISREIAPRALRSEGGRPMLSDPESMQPIMQKSLARVVESGVQKIMLIEAGETNQKAYHYIYDDQWTSSAGEFSFLPDPGELLPDRVWFSSPLADSSRLNLFMATPLPAPQMGLVVFDINISWFLNPFAKGIQSGKTGYAWIISEDGHFLYHPKTEFIGRDAFNVRKEEDPRLSFHTINFIQKEKMLKGLEGTGSYESGWHRGVTGHVEKLIAFTPIRLEGHYPRTWSIAVVAPISEIEGLVEDARSRQLLLQILLLMAVVSAACAVLFLEKRWSRYLEIEVKDRTQALMRSEEKYRSLVESAEDFIFTVEKNGDFYSLNPFTAGFFGEKPSDYIGMPLSSLFPEPAAKKIHALVQRVFRHGKSIRDIVDLPGKRGRTWINANFMPLKDKKGDVSTVLCIARDITEQKNLESRLINAEKLASMGTLAAGVAHEINNPLSVILGFSDLLIRSADPESQDFEDLKTIERQGLHCKQIVENLLSFARHGEETSETTDLNKCIREVVKIVKHTLDMNEIELDMRLSKPLSAVTGDFRQLQQVFLNLINNAVAAMPDGGILGISARQEEAGNGVVVTFSDTGTGISEADINRIFDPFYTTKPEGEGTGLGLFVSYGIISRYGGSIACESHTGETSGRQGTTFTITLKSVPERKGNVENTDH